MGRIFGAAGTSPTDGPKYLMVAKRYPAASWQTSSSRTVRRHRKGSRRAVDHKTARSGVVGEGQQWVLSANYINRQC